MRKTPILRQTEEYHSTYISLDLTNEQQRNGKLLRDEMKLYTNNGKANLWIQRGKVVDETERRFSVYICTQPSHVQDNNHVNNLKEKLYNVNSLDETLLNESMLQNCLKCLYINARSIINNLTSLKSNITEYNPDVIGIT